MTAFPQCPFCGAPADPATSYRRIQGWERKAVTASRRGGSDIALREQLSDYAHVSCVERERRGIAARQGALL